MFLFRKIQEELANHNPVARKIALKGANILKPIFPDVLCEQRSGNPFVLQQFPVNADYQHLFVVGPIENTDPAALGQPLHGAPKIIVIQFLRRGRLERMDLATLRIHTGHYVLDRSVLSRGVHGLEDEKERPTVLGIELLLEFGHQGNALLQKFLGVLLGMQFSGVSGIGVLQAKFLSVLHPIGLCQLVCPCHSAPPVSSPLRPLREGRSVQHPRSHKVGTPLSKNDRRIFTRRMSDHKPSRTAGQASTYL